MVYVEQKISAEDEHNSDLDKWLAPLAEYYSEEELATFRRAALTAQDGHEDQYRASGEPYISHVLAVAGILAELHMDAETVTAAVLHDVVEDTDYTLDDIREAFGEGVARMVDGVTKMSLINTLSEPRNSGRKEHERAESLRKLLLAMAEDVRVVLIKLADRLHNMRTLKYLSPAKQQRIAKETQDIYAPLANRLGIWQLKWELEDLSFRYLEPNTYKEIAKSLDERRVERQRYIDNVIETLERELGKLGMQARISGRPKHIFSIWKKMKRKGVGVNQIFDTRAVRVMVDSLPECYQALGVVHTLWRHIPREFDDYIATPKENLYQSIHTAVVGPEGKVLEVQIRTGAMHQHAELGVAAHWRYKEGGKGHDHGFEQKIAWLRQLLEWRDQEANANDFVDRFKSEVFQDRVYVLTPGGDIVDLPQGATPLDFAYHIHSEVGHRCRGAKVDGRMVPLTYELKSGEQVEILTARDSSPSRDWLNPHLGFLTTSRARSHIRHWFKEQDHDRHVIDGRSILERELQRIGASGIGYETLASEMGQNSAEDLMAAIGCGDLNPAQVAGAVNRLSVDSEPELPAIPSARSYKEQDSGKSQVHVHGVGNLLTTMARCCKPAPGDPIVGYITQGRGVTIHRRDCTNIMKNQDDKRHRLIEVEWSNTPSLERYPVDISLRALDREGLLRDITTLLAADKVNLLRVNTFTDKRDYMARMDLTLEITDTSQLSKVLSRIEQLPNVLEVKRNV